MTCTTRFSHELLYQDFAKVRFFEPASYADTYRWQSRPSPKSDFPVRDISRAPTIFKKFGEASEAKKYDVLIHARARRANRAGDNWPLENWKCLLPDLGGKIACVGTKAQALHLEGTDDLRGISLAALADILASSSVIIGGSSGAMHFATLCGLPQIVWSGVPRTMKRYEENWNPFNVPVFPIRKNHPFVAEVYEAFENAMPGQTV